MPLKPFRTLAQLAGTCLLAAAAALSGCVSNPPVLPQGPQTLSLAVQRLADDLIEQTDPTVIERMVARKVVLDPFIEAQSGQQTASSRKAGELLVERLKARNSSLKLQAFDAAGVAQADYLIAGTLRKNQSGSGSSGSSGSSSAYTLHATLTERRTGLVIASAVSSVQAGEIDATPTPFYADSPSIVSDRLTQGHVKTSQAARGASADQRYLASISTGALIQQATMAYDEGRSSDALLRYQEVVQRPDGKQLRVFNGLYNSHTKLGHAAEAEGAFSQIVALGLATNNLAVRLLFNPGSTEFWRDRNVSTIYPMWLRRIATETNAGDYCMTVVGHTSKTGTEAVNERLSLSRARYVRDALLTQDRQLASRVEVAGVGWQENIIGSGTDDARDSVDRRVEFKVRTCKGA